MAAARERRWASSPARSPSVSTESATDVASSSDRQRQRPLRSPASQRSPCYCSPVQTRTPRVVRETPTTSLRGSSFLWLAAFSPPSHGRGVAASAPARALSLHLSPPPPLPGTTADAAVVASSLAVSPAAAPRQLPPARPLAFSPMTESTVETRMRELCRTDGSACGGAVSPLSPAPDTTERLHEHLQRQRQGGASPSTPPPLPRALFSAAPSREAPRNGQGHSEYDAADGDEQPQWTAPSAAPVPHSPSRVVYRYDESTYFRALVAGSEWEPGAEQSRRSGMVAIVRLQGGQLTHQEAASRARIAEAETTQRAGLYAVHQTTASARTRSARQQTPQTLQGMHKYERYVVRGPPLQERSPVPPPSSSATGSQPPPRAQAPQHRPHGTGHPLQAAPATPSQASSSASRATVEDADELRCRSRVNAAQSARTDLLSQVSVAALFSSTPLPSRAVAAAANGARAEPPPLPLPTQARESTPPAGRRGRARPLSQRRTSDPNACGEPQPSDGTATAAESRLPLEVEEDECSATPPTGDASTPHSLERWHCGEEPVGRTDQLPANGTGVSAEREVQHPALPPASPDDSARECQESAERGPCEGEPARASRPAAAEPVILTAAGANAGAAAGNGALPRAAEVAEREADELPPDASEEEEVEEEEDDGDGDVPLDSGAVTSLERADGAAAADSDSASFAYRLSPSRPRTPDERPPIILPRQGQRRSSSSSHDVHADVCLAAALLSPLTDEETDCRLLLTGECPPPAVFARWAERFFHDSRHDSAADGSATAVAAAAAARPAELMRHEPAARQSSCAAESLRLSSSSSHPLQTAASPPRPSDAPALVPVRRLSSVLSRSQSQSSASSLIAAAAYQQQLEDRLLRAREAELSSPHAIGRARRHRAARSRGRHGSCGSADSDGAPVAREKEDDDAVDGSDDGEGDDDASASDEGDGHEGEVVARAGGGASSSVARPPSLAPTYCSYSDDYVVGDVANEQQDTGRAERQSSAARQAIPLAGELLSPLSIEATMAAEGEGDSENAAPAAAEWLLPTTDTYVPPAGSEADERLQLREVFEEGCAWIRELEAHGSLSE